MQQGGISITREPFCQFVNAIEQRNEIGLWIGGWHGLGRGIQIRERIEQIFFQRIVHKESLYAIGTLTNESFQF